MRIRGTVKWFNDTKGYGFLRRDDGQSDCFVHHSDIQSEGYRSLQEGERIEFDVIEQPKGPKASNVVKVSELDGEAAGGGDDSAASSEPQEVSFDSAASSEPQEVSFDSAASSEPQEVSFDSAASSEPQEVSFESAIDSDSGSDSSEE